MSITKEQQQALDDALVPREQRLRIVNCNYRLRTTFKPKEPTFQVALDVFSLTPFYQAFLITVSVPAIYMHEFWATVSYHKHNIKFKMNKKNYSFDLETFGDMFQICPNLPRRKFVDPPFEEEILSFIKELGYSGNVKSFSEIKVDTLPQPWRTFGTIINKCLSGKETGLDLLRLSRAQILWGMYHQKYVDNVYLIWEDLVYQIENKVSKKNKDMYYPRFTKVIINHFMSKDQSIPRRNKMDWHMASNDPILTTMRFIPQHEVVQKYGAILPDTLTNQAMKESVAENTKQDPKASPGKRLKATAKVAKSGNKKLPAQGLETLSEIALTKAEQMTIVTKRSKTQFHSFHASGSGADERTGVSPGVPDVPTYGSEDEQISWKSSDEDDDDEVSKSKDDDDDADNEDDDGQDDDDQDDENEQTESENDGDDFVYPKYSTHDQEERQDEEDKEEEGSDLRVQTPSHYESTDDEETQGVNVEGEELDEEDINEEEEANELYRDVNVNLKGRDTKMTYTLQTNIQGFISNMLNPNPDKGIDSILNLNPESTSLVDVPVSMNVEMPPSSVTPLLSPPIPFIQPQQQTPVPTPTIVPSTTLQNLPTFGSLFKFEDKVKALEDNFLEFQQTNQFAAAVSLIPSIVDTYLANKMNEAVKTVVQLQSGKLRDEAQAENENFINTLDENMRKIIIKQVKEQIKEQVSKILSKIEKFVNDQLKAEILTRSSNQAKTSHVVAANQSELKLKKILIDKIENNKSIDRSIQQKTLYKALVDAYETDKDILETYGDSEFDIGFTEDQSVDQTTQHPDWFPKPTKPPTPDRDWNKTFPTRHGLVQPWISTLARNEDPHESFNKLMDTPLDFSIFMINRLKVDTLTPELLVGPTYALMKGSCKSLVELEYFLEEVYKATTDQLDWNNPEGQQYPHDLLTKTKAADYGHIKWIEDFVPNSMRTQVPIIYDKHALWGISHWGRKRQQFYGFAVNRESARDVYSKHRILAITKLKIVKWHNYKYLDWITVRKLTNLNVEERLALGVSMFTRSVVLRRRVEDLQIGVKSHQKKLNLTRPDTYKLNLKRKTPYTTYSNPKGFIYQNKDKKNRLMRIDELHKFSDGTLNDVWSALDDILK
ncbi:hypothetical protein Tco_0181059 [Tanacetum coccineum]